MNMVEKLMKKWFGGKKQEDPQEDPFEMFSPVDYKFVANKIIEQVQNTPNYNFYPFTNARLSKLVLLTDIRFRQQHNKPLIKDEYQCYTLNGVVLSDVYDDYQNSDKHPERIYMNAYFPFSQEDYEKDVGKKVNDGINELVKEIVTMTEFVDVSTLIILTENTSVAYWQNHNITLEQWKEMYNDGDVIPQRIISKWYESFDFDKVIEINNTNKEEFSASK